MTRQAVVVSDGRRHATVIYYPGLGRMDLIVDGKSTDFTNIVNDDVPKEGALEDRLRQWGRERLQHFRICGLCGKETYAPPLRDYDLENFPDLKGKVVCSDCRRGRYDEKIGELIQEEKKQMLDGFPTAGPIVLTNINLCTFPECNCGWNVTLKIESKMALSGLQLKGLVVHIKGDVVRISGTADQWRRLAEICKAAGGELPPGYPPS
jgi:hypothetical protein